VRIARFSVSDQIAFGVVSGLGEGGEGGEGGEAGGPYVTAIDGHPFAPFELTTARFPLAQVRLLAPVVPSKVVGVGANYPARDHDRGADAGADPVLFLKPSTSVVGPEDAVMLPALSRQVHHQADLAVVIGRLVSRVPLERALEAVLGYTCANDVTASDLQRADSQWARAKGFDSFCPLGPWVETELDPSDLAVECLVDGQLRQSGRTKDMLHSVAELVAYVSAVMTLLPGDVLLTGTPDGAGPVQDGDVVEVRVEGVGTLRNRVAA
jgi:2-keto-4-pentenoate hydratase/2-oxohepta-3-ene-1,7-dioic acid hydratase in catechol pathway